MSNNYCLKASGKQIVELARLMDVHSRRTGFDEPILYLGDACRLEPIPYSKVYATTLVAANEAGATAIYKAGGAQAIAALAYGTESIPKVDKIVGPGNIFVALAKRAVYGHVSIDSIAGPSEILVIADETANPKYVAADLLSQAEHDEMASAILITTSKELAEKVSAQVDEFIEVLSRKEIIRKSIDTYG